MVEERRNDIGLKMAYGVVAVILSLFIHVTWSTANSGNQQAAQNAIKIAGMESRISSILDDTQEIKNLLKRSIP